MKKLYVLLILLLFGLSPGTAQEKLSLEECINYAIERNLQYQLNQLDTRQSRLNYKDNKMDRWPSVNASVGQGFRYGRNIDPYTNEFVQESINSNSFSLNSGVQLFKGFQLTNQIKSSKYSLKASKSAEEALKNDIRMQVTSYYLDILLQRERVETADSQLATTKALLERARLLVESGKANKTELLELKAQYSSDHAQLVEAKNQLEMAKLNLEQYLNWEKQQQLRIQDVTLPDTLNDLPEKNINQVIQENYQRLPEIQQARNRLQSSEFALKAAKGSRSPSLTFNASLQSGYSSRTREVEDYQVVTDTIGFVRSSNEPVLRPTVNPQSFTPVPFWEQLENNFGQVLSLGLNIPIFNNYSIENQIQTAEIQHTKAQINLQQQKQGVRKTIRQAYVQASNYYEQYQAAKQQLASQQTLFEHANIQYKEGAMSFYDWQSSKNNLTRARNDFLQAKYQYLFNKKIYEFYLGRSLTFEQNN